jgi:hypothetical protein
MKRYLVFAGDDFYPSGGWKDLKDSFNSFEEADLYLQSIISIRNKRKDDFIILKEVGD